MNHHELVRSIREGTGEFFVPFTSLSERWDRCFHDPVHNPLRSELDKFETRTLDEFGDIRIGRLPSHVTRREHGEYLILTGRHISKSNLSLFDGERFVNHTDEAWREQDVVQPGDIVFSLIGPNAYVYKGSDPPAIAGNNVAVLRTPNSEYINTYLSTPDGVRVFNADFRDPLIRDSFAVLTQRIASNLKDFGDFDSRES